MNAMAKRYLALMLSIIMVFSFNPINTYAAESTGTYVQINSADELTSGKYIMIVNSGYALGCLDVNWLLATALTPSEGMVVNPDQTLVWDLAVSESGVILKDANGLVIKPVGGNNNGIMQGDYTWSLVSDSGTFSFKGIGDDTVTLASNKSSGNRFRAYKTSTVVDYSYPANFTLYKLDEEVPPVKTKADTPTANVPSGNVVSGSAI